jgi:hypothetical protein
MTKVTIIIQNCSKKDRMNQEQRQVNAILKQLGYNGEV